jgi:H+/Cl- antiporter ClcA
MVDDTWVAVAAIVCSIAGFLSGWFWYARKHKAESAGEIEIAELLDGNRVFSLNLNYPPEELQSKSVVSFYIVSTSNKS